MKFFDKISKSLENLDKKVTDKLEGAEASWNSKLNGIEASLTNKIADLDTSSLNKSAMSNKSISKDDLATFLHVINEQNYSTFGEHHLALKDFFFKSSPESQNFTISKHISIGVRTGSRREILQGKNPLIELLIDEVNQKFVLCNLRDRDVHDFYHFSEVIDFAYDELTDSNESITLGSRVIRMVIDVKFNRLDASLSIPFMNDDGIYFVRVTDNFYKHQRENANEVLGAFTYMKNLVSANNQITINTQPPNQINIADELRKFKQLQEEGLISAEDFELKKKQLIGI